MVNLLKWRQAHLPDNKFCPRVPLGIEMPTFINVYHQFKKSIFQIPHQIPQNRKNFFFFSFESFLFLRTLLVLFAAKALFTSSSSSYKRGIWMKKKLPLSPSVFVGASPRAGALFPAHHSHLKRVFWLKTHYASWSWYLSSVLESSLLLFLKLDCPLFSFASSSEDYYRSLRLLYSACHVTLSSACLSVLHSGLTPPMNFSAHSLSLRPCLSKTLICRLRVLKTFVLISRSFILFFSNIPDLLEYCFFLMSPVYLLILVFNQLKHIYGL